MVVIPQQQVSRGESNDGNDEDVVESVSLHRLIQLIGELLEGWEKSSFINEQEITNVYLL